jgi:hypothetical protein
LFSRYSSPAILLIMRGRPCRCDSARERRYVHDAGRVDHDQRAYPERLGRFFPELILAPLPVEMSNVPVGHAGPVPLSRQGDRNVATNLDDGPGELTD